MLRATRLLLVAFATLSLAAAANAQTTATPPAAPTTGGSVTLPATLSPSNVVTLPAITLAPPEVSAPKLDPKPGTFVVVKDGATTVSGGSFIGEMILWAAMFVGAPLAGLLGAWLVKLLKKAGVEVSDADRKRLQEIVENGIALAAQRAKTSLKDKLPINVRSAVAIDALQYVHDHGTDTLKALGFDPKDPKAIEAVQARIAKAMDAAEVVAPVAPATPA